MAAIGISKPLHDTYNGLESVLILLPVKPIEIRELCSQVSDTASRRLRRSAVSGERLVPRVKTLTRNRRAFSNVGPFRLKLASLGDNYAPSERIPERHCKRKNNVRKFLHTPINVLLSCARAQVTKRAHTRKLGAHINVSSKICFAYISYTSFHIQINSDEMWHKRNLMRTQTLIN